MNQPITNKLFLPLNCGLICHLVQLSVVFLLQPTSKQPVWLVMPVCAAGGLSSESLTISRLNKLSKSYASLWAEMKSVWSRTEWAGVCWSRVMGNQQCLSKTCCSLKRATNTSHRQRPKEGSDLHVRAFLIRLTVSCTLESKAPPPSKQLLNPSEVRWSGVSESSTRSDFSPQHQHAGVHVSVSPVSLWRTYIQTHTGITPVHSCLLALHGKKPTWSNHSGKTNI